MSSLWDRFVAALVEVWQFAYAHPFWLLFGSLGLMLAWGLLEALRPDKRAKERSRG